MKMRKIFAAGAASLMLIVLMSMTAFAGWKSDGGGWWYEKSGGGYYTNTLVTLEDGKYAFGPDGYMMSNAWVKAGGKWYYLGQTGMAVTNRWVGNYYLGGDGVMLTNTWTPDGYYVGADGAWDASKGRQTSGGSTISDIVPGYYSSVGISGDTQNYRTDLFAHYTGSGMELQFGHYEASGSPYGLYDSVNPNGDNLTLYMDNGVLKGKSSISGNSYKVEVSGDTITIYWRSVTWNHSSNRIVVKLKYGESGAVG